MVTQTDATIRLFHMAFRISRVFYVSGIETRQVKGVDTVVIGIQKSVMSLINLICSKGRITADKPSEELNLPQIQAEKVIEPL